MPVNITTPQTKTFYVDESNQGWVLTSSGSITSADGHGIVNNDAFHDSAITVAGDIVANAMYKSGILSNGQSATLKVETGGSIHGYGGISFYGENTQVENFGKITAVNAGIYGNAAGSKITNAGTINAKYGIYVDSPEIGAGKAVYNSGVITADYGVLAQNSSFELTNKTTGEIHGKVVAVSLGGNDHTDYNNVNNFGLIESGGIAIQGSIGKDLIVNHGTIKGAVVLGAGDDTFDNRDGTMTYSVNGGEGDDTYVFGATAFTIVEGGGNDTIGTTITRTLADFTSIENLQLYGKANINGTGNAQQNYIIGNGGNNVLDGGADNVVDTLLGGEGNDTYVLRGGADIVFEGGGADGKANTGTDTIVSTTDRNLVQYERIENLTITGNADVALTGNELANVLTGNSGKNSLDGGVEEGDVIDTLNGGAGDDTYWLGSGYDKIIDSAGMDLIASDISRSLADYATIEKLSLRGNANISGTGNALVNFISGNNGNNILDGGVDTVTDTLIGGGGNDIYILGSGTDTVIDTAGHDTITSTITRSLANYATIEDLGLKGTANINATGNALANVIVGNAGNNILDGGNDNVVDTLMGDVDGISSNDTYVLRAGSDIVIDEGGIDTITSTISRSLMSYSGIENLTLVGNGNINATGNALANVLTGNSGMNTLDGGAGNDTYVLGAGSDKVVDSAGVDTITSLVSRSLSTYATIENLKLVGVSNINATGNALANTLAGNSGANTLSGGAGNDVLIGGAGVDKLDGGANTDTASYTGASAGVVANLANASANTGDAKGDSYVSIENLAGSSHNDTLTGNSGVNALYGGAGADKLTGGAGADTFLFKAVGDTTVATAGQDTVFDFSHAQGDKIGLSGFDANTALSGDQAFVFKGTAAFSGGKGELHFDKQASDTYVYGDINGDKVADFVLHFDDAIAFQASDFIL